MKELERLLRKISSSAYVSGLNDTEHHEDEDKAKQAILKMDEEKDKRISELEGRVSALIEFASDCLIYVPEYFREKYKMDDEFNTLKKLQEKPLEEEK